MLSFCYNCHNNIKDINTGTILTKDRLILNKTCLFKKSALVVVSKSQNVTKHLLTQNSNSECWLIT